MRYIFALFFALFSLLLHAQTTQKKHIFVLHSYSQEYPWTKSQHQGYVSTLKHSLKTEPDISTEYLDTKRLAFDDAYQSFFLAYLQNKYKNYHPDAIYVTDDNALKFFINHKPLLFADTPLFFSGINDLSLSKELNSKGFRGVFETKEIIPNVKLIQQFSPQTRDIWILGDNSTTYHAIESDLKSQISHFPNHTFHFISSSKIDEILLNLPKKTKSFVILTTIGGWEDGYGHILTIDESISRLRMNRSLLMYSMEDAYVTGGVIGGFVTSGSRQGSLSASLTARYLHGESLQHIRSLEKSPNIYLFDRRALTDSRLILSEYLARDAVIINQSESFFESNKQAIMDLFFLISIIVPVLSIILFFAYRDKKAQLTDAQSLLSDLRKDNNLLITVLSRFEQDGSTGYWVWKRQDGSLFLSEGFIKIFQNNESEQMELDDLIEMVHPKDKYTLQTAIKSLNETSASRTLRHKIVCVDGTVKSILHHILYVPDKDPMDGTVIGTVQELHE